MRVWLVPSAFFPHKGGVEELTLKLAQQLQARGADVTVVTSRWPGRPPAIDTVEGVPVRRLDFVTPGRHPASVLHYAMQRKRMQADLVSIGRPPDLLHIQCASVQLPSVARYARAHRVPLIITTQGEVVMDADRLYQRSPYMRWSLRREAQRAAELTTCSRWTALATVPVAPAFAGSEVILNGVDPDDWEVGPVPAEPVFAAWGRHVPQKGFDLLLSAFDLMREERPEARLLIGGDGPETEKLRRTAVPGVAFLGPLDRLGVRDLLSRARVVVVPSRIEPFGIVALEALAAGRGLVYSAGTGLAEAASGCGRKANVANPRALADAMLAELAEPTRPDQGQARARELAWNAIADQYVALYERVLRSATR